MSDVPIEDPPAHAQERYAAWIANVRRTPAACLRLELLTERPFSCEDLLGSRLNGAFWAGLQVVADYHPEERMRWWARTALSFHDRFRVANGLKERPVVLQMPDSPLVLEGNGVLTVGLLLIGDAAATWPAWVNAAAELDLRPGQFRLNAALLQTTDGEQDAGVLPCAWPGITSLGRLEAAQPLPPADRLAVQFLSPAEITHQRRPCTSFPTAEPLLRSALRALSEASWRQPGADLTAWLAGLAAQVANPNPERLTEKRMAHRENRQMVTFRGVTGRVPLQAMPALVREVLSLARFTHVGQRAAFGFGRYDLVAADTDVME